MSTTEHLNEYELAERQGWTRVTLADLALGFLQDHSRDDWLAHLRDVAAEENEWGSGNR